MNYLSTGWSGFNWILAISISASYWPGQWKWHVQRCVRPALTCDSVCIRVRCFFFSRWTIDYRHNGWFTHFPAHIQCIPHNAFKFSISKSIQNWVLFFQILRCFVTLVKICTRCQACFLCFLSNIVSSSVRPHFLVDSVDGRNPANHLWCIYETLLKRLLARFLPSTVSPGCLGRCFFATTYPT